MKIFKIFAFKEVDPTKGSIIKNTIELVKPLWYMTGFWIVVHLLNLYWVSKLGEEAISAVAIGGAAFMVMMAPIQGIVTASVSLVGSFDRKDRNGLDRLAKQILTLACFVSIALTILGYFIAPLLIQLLGAEAEVTSLAVAYLRISVLGGILSFLFWPINDMIRATRDMFRPMLLIALVLGLQGVFDYLFILGNLGFPKLGTEGAALSLALSAAIGAVVGFLLLISGKLFIKIDIRKWRDFKVDIRTLKEIINIAGFDTLEGLTRTAIGMVMLAIIAPFGTLALAAFAIGQRFFRYVSSLGGDLGKTAIITISNTLGAGNTERAEKSAWVISAINVSIFGFVGLLFFICADQIIGIFSQDQEVLAIGSAYFRITALCGLGYIFFAAGHILQRAFAGAKDTRTPLLVYWLMVVIQVGLALLLPRFWGLGVNGVWIAILIGMVFHGSVLTILFKIGRWKPKPLTKS